MLLGAAALSAVAYGVWWAIDDVLGRSLPAQIVSVGLALVLGSAAYAGVVLGLKIPEARADPRPFRRDGSGALVT